jgi:hypothetical protein
MNLGTIEGDAEAALRAVETVASVAVPFVPGAGAAVAATRVAEAALQAIDPGAVPATAVTATAAIGAAPAAVPHAASSTGADSGLGIIGDLATRVAQLESVALSPPADPLPALFARVQALEDQAEKFEQSHPLIGRMFGVLQKLLPGEMGK